MEILKMIGGTVLLVIALGICLGTALMVSDYNKEDKDPKYKPEYTPIENYLYSIGVFAVIAIVIWMIGFGIKLLMG